jgi:hypothetical protein
MEQPQVAHETAVAVAKEEVLDTFEAAAVVALDYTAVMGSFVASILRLTPRDGLFGEFYFLRWSDGVANEWIEGYQNYRDASARLGELVTAVSNDELMTETARMIMLVPEQEEGDGAREMTDSQALDLILKGMRTPEWSVSFLEDIAAIVKRTGRDTDLGHRSDREAHRPRHRSAQSESTRGGLARSLARGSVHEAERRHARS